MNSLLKDARLTGVVVIFSLIIVGLVSYAVGGNSTEVRGYSAVYYCALIAIGVQWLAWVPASIWKTERFYDLAGGLTYLSILSFSLWAGSLENSPGLREILVSSLVVIWSLRLSGFLYLRIHKAGKDGRFDDLKTSPIRFLVPWTLQGLWVFLTMNVVIVINSQSAQSPPLGAWDLIGLGLWIIGFVVEVVADNQKTSFKANPDNRGKWIESGLWSISRHPNYLGEILLWVGIACFGIVCFTGLEMVAWTSPLFVYLLLTKVSGVPILDKSGLEKWGDDPDYQRYRETTPELFPRLRTR